MCECYNGDHSLRLDYYKVTFGITLLIPTEGPKGPLGRKLSYSCHGAAERLLGATMAVWGEMK